MLCPKCKIEAENKRDSQGNWSAFCRNPQCADYGRVIKVILKNEAAEKTVSEEDVTACND